MREHLGGGLPHFGLPPPEFRIHPRPEIDEAHLATLLEMGFAENKCRRALEITRNNVERATEMLLASDPALEN